MPDISRYFTEEICHGNDNIGRLRHVAVHRWDLDAYLVRDAVEWLAILGDEEGIMDIEDELGDLLAQDKRMIKMDIRCGTKNEFLTALVRILEQALYRFAETKGLKLGLEHAHACELSVLAEKCLFAACGDEGREQVREALNICRALRNAAAHHNSFSPEAIENRSASATIVCRYDRAEDPYRAMARDAEKVALLVGDEKAARDIRLVEWVGDACIGCPCEDEEEEDEDEDEDDEENSESDKPMDYLHLAHQAKMGRASLGMVNASCEAERTVFELYCQATAHFEQCAAEIIPGAEAVFASWTRDIVGGVADPRMEISTGVWE